MRVISIDILDMADPFDTFFSGFELILLNMTNRVFKNKQLRHQPDRLVEQAIEALETGRDSL